MLRGSPCSRLVHEAGNALNKPAYMLESKVQLTELRDSNAPPANVGPQQW